MHVYPEAWNSQKQRGIAATDWRPRDAAASSASSATAGMKQDSKWQIFLTYAKQKDGPVLG